ncbi:MULTISPECIES: EamA family transporter RarD [unclassified Fusibacter]|uniref:EamA family transporter RarD n=1 Tax=unclassified Fusibacter TaxID=2624464 RepID=UPI001011DE32|nr:MULTISPECIES: EamA family transporter RarD [unclassified Fusibacter]MCK8060357.1 EamA family transporter RarD [Fusibacter sp. A2]NPE20354.1 EamA family transporter RarD [Fusibacter sp. A1]RXV63560.1 EamA family transporter RarD [Fusibacter sp. A1]
MNKKNYLSGLAFGTSAFILWGLLPLYWKLVSAISPYQIFSQRVVWSLVFVLGILLVTKEWDAFKRLVTQREMWLKMLGPAVFISINWLTYIWSVNNGYVIEASLGYYINPLVLTLFGLVLFKERLNGLQWIGILFAATGVIYKTITYGQVPYVALVLAVSFAIYGVLKKVSKVGSVLGLGFETLIVGIPAFVYLLTQEASGHGITGNLPAGFWILISISGLATATPLLLYAESTKRLPLNVMGFLQYIAPTISLMLGIFVFKEAFDLNSLISFLLIWTGLLSFSIAQVIAYKELPDL